MPIDLSELRKMKAVASLAVTNEAAEDMHSPLTGVNHSGSLTATTTMENNEPDKTTVKAPKLGVITMKDIDSYEPDPSLYLVGEGHIIRGRDRLHLLVGYAGIGKTRATSYLAYCGVTGQRWFDYEIKHRFKTLFIQLEGGMPRLKRDFEGITQILDGHVFFLNMPYGASFQDPQFRNQVRDVILRYGIGLVIIDPWTNISADTNHKDYNTIINCVLECLPENPKDCPAVLVVAHLRKPDNKSKAKRGAELMHEVNGAQVLTSRSRFVLAMERANLSDDSDDRILVTCAKANDALQTPRSCHRRGKVIFQEVIDFDWEEREQPLKPGRKAQYTLNDVVDLLDRGQTIKSGEWKKRAKDKLGMSDGSFYAFLKEALAQGQVHEIEKSIYERSELKDAVALATPTTPPKGVLLE